MKVEGSDCEQAILSKVSSENILLICEVDLYYL